MGKKCWNYKCGLLAINSILLLISLALLSLGSFLQSAFHVYLGMLKGRMTSPAILIICLGLILFASSLFGFISTIKESYILLSTYVCLLVTITIFEIAVGVAVFSMKSSVKKLVIHAMQVAEAHYNSSKAMACMWDTVQNYLKCCGMNRFEEWHNFLGADTVPDSCCVHYSLGCGHNINSTNIHKYGCLSAIHNWYFQNQVIIVALCTVFILIQLTALLLAHNYCNILNQRCTVSRRNLTIKSIFKLFIRTQ